ncbi:hypothetical protein FEK35_04665 [Nocardia cyriacigeorgica]|uniref:Uncharacterized protein n=1 Tax=Nocardia cyriacigeorgica TaxID=135487 RepID=A0A5R8PIZ7_9NOCA|nr:hypothetical protein FEK35_04665 [Nocardia cyriacigeorgica]
MAVGNVYFLTMHEPYQTPEHAVPINATIVHGLSLLHPTVPQPDGGRIYRCLTEFPGRTAGCLVPLSTLTYELNGGQLWHMVGDWQPVSEAVAYLARTKQCDAMPIGLPPIAAALLSGGPTTIHTLHHTDGRQVHVGPTERQQQLLDLTRHVGAYAAQGAFWPGDNLVVPPIAPTRMPYQPHK